MEKVRTRFAPSPTGYMHIGNLRTALYEYLVAKKDGGDFLLRIEDTDQERQVDGAVEIIYNTLKEVGLLHDEGPDIGGNYGPYIQSERKPIYKEYADKLVDLGGAHYCFCSEEEIQSQREVADKIGVSFKFQDPCHDQSIEDARKRIAAGEKYTVRQTINSEGVTFFDDLVYGRIEVENANLDENILLKSDGFPTYNFANIVDDHLMAISHVVRGNEYLSSTPKYNLVYQSFGWDIPKYIHLPPVMKDEQHKLSKRNGDASFQDLVSKGYLPEAILNYIALLGWSPETEQEIYTLEELTQVFNIAHINRSPAIFDIEKLNWMNGVYLRNMTLDQFHELVLPYYANAIQHDVCLKEVSKILQPRLTLLGEIQESVDFIDQLPIYDNELYINKKMKTTPEIALSSLKTAYEALKVQEDWTEATLHDLLMSLVEKAGIKNGQMLYPVRVALSGKQFTPGGAIELAHILGKEESLLRIEQGIHQLSN